MQLVSVTKSGSCKIQDEKYEPKQGHASVTYQLHAEDLDGNGNILPKQRRLMDNTLVKMISDSVDASKVAKDERRSKK
jgi:hypothetical protein